ncbi:hypothetical protein BDZ45DRAFT_809326 [Acephala macrosclerotiorum]|nr:hypothetical protein BDZ45DRAFT_809326 [Acephala macrosclerotiorum]
MAAPKTETYQGTRLTFQSSKSFEEVMDKLYSSIGGPERIGGWKKPVYGVTAENFEEARKKFEERIRGVLGLHEFMIFEVFDHGSWIPLYGVGSGLKSKRIILGNPLIAITMIRHDFTAGLAVPVEVLVSEVMVGEEKRTQVMYNLPSGLIAGVNKKEELVAAAEALDAKLEMLVRWVCE